MCVCGGGGLFQLNASNAWYGSVKLQLTNNEKIGNGHLFLCYCRYFYKKYKYVSGVVLGFSKHADFVRITDFDWLSLQQRCLIFYKP